MRLSDDQQSLRELAGRVARERLAPGYQQREREAAGIDRALCREMGGLGLVGVDLPEAFGGLAMDGVTTGLLIEDIAYGDINVSYVQLLASLMGTIIARNASPELAQAWLPKLVAGEAIVALGLTEPRGGSDAAHLHAGVLAVRRQGDRLIKAFSRVLLACMGLNAGPKAPGGVR